MTPSAAIFVSLVIAAFAAFMVTLGSVAIYVRTPTPRRAVVATQQASSIQAKRVSA